jgi:subtilase family serine protease
MRRLLLLLLAATLHAQQNRIVTHIDPTRLQTLPGNLRPATFLLNDAGRIDHDFPLPALTLQLKSSTAQQADLRQLLESQRDPDSPLFHQWLTPEQFADRFGLSQDDVSATTTWLRAQGFSVTKVSRSRTWIVFSGTARQAEAAFHTEIHHYMLAGRIHFANATEPSIPASLAPVVSGIDGLDDFLPEPEPQQNSPTGVHTLAPDDIATIYNIAAVYQSGIDGTGQKIAIVGASDFDATALADVAQFRAKFNLPPNVPQVIRDTSYPDPGVSGSYGEAHLDVEWSGAVARNAQIIFVYSNTFIHAALYAVDNNVAPVLSMSANNGCEAANTSANITFYHGVAQQANSQGMTWVISGGDAGPAACDANGAAIAMSGLGVRFPASIPEVTAVGGTEFNEGTGNYWSSTNTSNGASARSYIPEMVWNDDLALSLLWAGGGGTSIVFPKPPWQAGPGVPSDNARHMPDLAMAASFYHDGFYIIKNGAASITGGTSAAAPVFAGVLALLNHYLVANKIMSTPGLGNVNPTLYQLANATRTVFHDITVGNNIVVCVTGTPNCSSGAMGFSAAPGYDLASGLGSVNVAQLLQCHPRGHEKDAAFTCLDHRSK